MMDGSPQQIDRERQAVVRWDINHRKLDAICNPHRQTGKARLEVGMLKRRIE
jgi:hypothetical protein